MFQGNGPERLREIKRKGEMPPEQRDNYTRQGSKPRRQVQRHLHHDARPQERSGHLGCFGTTRIGKTRLMESIIEQDIRKGYNVAIIDPKGDIDLFSKVIQASAESGRLEEVMLLTPIYPDHSVKLDPLSHYYMEDELVDHVVSGIKAKEDYFIAIASEVTGAVVSGLAIKAKTGQGSERQFQRHQVPGHVQGPPGPEAGASSLKGRPSGGGGSMRQHRTDPLVNPGVLLQGGIVPKDHAVGPFFGQYGQDHRQKLCERIRGPFRGR